MDPWHRRAPGRFIPAGAGNTQPCSPKRSVTPVYPRWRGEHGEAPRPPSGGRGLSPLARGTRQQSAGRWLTARFIPAGAGNSGGSLCLLTWITVYPRWRGEHRQPPDVMNSRRGLSPLARGTQAAQGDNRTPPRFIPAGAGNTRWEFAMIILYTVYPRWRGEHAVMAIGHAAGGGLSPLARGTPNGSDVRRLRYRFIPAGAGNTTLAISPCRSVTVYPRWRGEHSTVTSCQDTSRGLSPLARGTRGEFSRNARLSRFIPAGAGNTLRRPR